MYYTPAGGDIMFVEAALMPGKGDLILTGQLGDVMKESARAAWTYARAHASWLGIDDRVFLKEKILGAVRAGITHVVIPRDNEADLDDLPGDVRDKLVVTPVDTLAEALAVTLRDTTLRDGRLFFGQRVSPVSELAH
jgi:ATP-dependent Lon protease